MKHTLRIPSITALLFAILGAVMIFVPANAASASTPASVSVQQSSGPAFNADAPDPNIVYSGGVYYAFTTGTALGNNLQALIDTSGTPGSGWRSYTGTNYGSSALPSPPAWQQIGTETSPGVSYWGGKWVMFYDAALSGYTSGTGHDCLSVATAATLTPSHPVFTDHSSTPLVCQWSGSIDPSPFVDPTTGIPYLTWKSNDGVAGVPARIWTQQLGADGTTLVGSPTQMLVQDTVAFPWESTVENPDMVSVGGTYYLLFSTGNYASSGYAEAFATCAGPVGPCTQPPGGPFVASYGVAVGPGGGSVFQDQSGNWNMAYAAWAPGCVGYAAPGCTGARRLFVGAATFTHAGLPGVVTGMSATPTGNGYWLVNSAGWVSPHGSAPVLGSMAGRALNAPIEHIVATPDGGGYWMVASDGGIFSFGDAGFYGSTGAQHLNAPVVDMAPTPDGRGYWLVASDGGVFAFGDAVFHGSMGGQHLNRPIVGVAADTGTGGYWLVASDGGVFSFGAPFYGSTGNLTLTLPVNGMSATSGGGGYWFVASDGGVFAFGDAKFRGSTGGIHLNAPVVGMATDPATGGYWLVATDGGVFSFGAPFYGGD